MGPETEPGHRKHRKAHQITDIGPRTAGAASTLSGLQAFQIRQGDGLLGQAPAQGFQQQLERGMASQVLVAEQGAAVAERGRGVEGNQARAG
jgi:hypothetical protein